MNVCVLNECVYECVCVCVVRRPVCESGVGARGETSKEEEDQDST